MVALRKVLPGRMSVAEFLVWDSGDRTGPHWQLRDGVPEAMEPTTEAHGAIQGELAALIRNHLLQIGSKCRVVIDAGVVPRVRSSNNDRIPDLAVTCSPIAGERLMRDPLLLIEILSPSNTDQTRANVWTYTTLPSVAEILVIHSMVVNAELLRRAADGSWPEQPDLIEEGGILRLDSIGLELPLATVYRTALAG